MGIKALIYFELVTTAALFIGLAAINLSGAGFGVQLPLSPPAEQVSAVKPVAMSPGDIILHLFPENIAQSVAEGQVLQVVVFSIIFAIALALLSEQKRRPMLSFAEGLTDAMFKFTNIVMLFAPVGVGAAIAYTIGHTGMGVLVNLIKLLATLYVALLAFLLLVLLPVALLAKIPLRRFIQAIAEPVSIAFATSSSEAALPSAMESMEALGVPRPIVAFVIPMGYSFNLDGTTLYLSLASIFVAQAAGLHLTIGQQLLMMLTLMLTSKGVAGVSRGALVVLLATVPSFGLPTEPALILLGVDQLMDMARTSVNVVGNCLATAVMARWEGEPTK
jgi:proton glutamate symport protein